MDVEELRNSLELLGLNTDNLEDNDISNLYNLHKKYLLSITGINPEVMDKRIYDISLTKFKFKNYIMEDYPILKINNVKIDGKELDENNYYVNLSGGIIRWKTPVYGETLEINYQKEVTEDIKDLIDTIIFDLICKTIDVKGDIKTIKEGDVSLTYETENNLSNSINKNIDKLIELYNLKPYSKMIR